MATPEHTTHLRSQFVTESFPRNPRSGAPRQHSRSVSCVGLGSDHDDTGGRVAVERTFAACWEVSCIDDDEIRIEVFDLASEITAETVL